VKMVISAAWMLDWLAYAIIPFVILGNELNMGVYLTVSSIVGIIISIATNRLAVKTKAKLGGPLLAIVSLTDAFLVANFTPFALYLNSIVSTVAGSIVAPMEFDMSVRISNAMDSRNEMAVELNIFQEFVYTVARIIVGSIVLAIIAFGLPVLLVLKTLIVLYALLKITNYLLSVKFLKYGKNAVIASTTAN